MGMGEDFGKTYMTLGEANIAGRPLADIGDADPKCPHAMMALKDVLVNAFFTNNVNRSELKVRGVYIKGRGIPDLHVDTETQIFDIWVTIIDRNQFIVRRHRKDTYKREKWVFSIQAVADGYAQQYVNKLIGAVLYTP